MDNTVYIMKLLRDEYQTAERIVDRMRGQTRMPMSTATDRYNAACHRLEVARVALRLAEFYVGEMEKREAEKGTEKAKI